MTAAHKSLPLPTYVQVTNLRNGRTVVLRVNDRGPFHDNRILDLSYAAARKLDILRDGTGLVEVRALTPDQGPAPSVIPVSAAAVAPPSAAQPLSMTGISAAPSPGSAPPVLYLQVGAFSDRRNAERLMTRIASIERARPRIQDLELNGQHIYRVRLGPMASVEEADRVSSSVVAAGMELPHIVIE
jgi:rare lipoprotein A